MADTASINEIHEQEPCLFEFEKKNQKKLLLSRCDVFNLSF